MYGTSERTRGVDTPIAAGELRLVQEAILMVSSFGMPRVLVAGLQHGRLILEHCEFLAEQAGVRVVPLRTADEHRLDILVERIPTCSAGTR